MTLHRLFVSIIITVVYVYDIPECRAYQSSTNNNNNVPTNKTIKQIHSDWMYIPETPAVPWSDNLDVLHDDSFARPYRKESKDLFFAVLFYDDPYDTEATVTINSAIDIAIEKVQAVGGLLNGFNITTEYRDTQSSSTHGVIQAFDLYDKRKPDAFFGPMEEYTLGPVARYCSAWEIPVLTPGGMVKNFEEKYEYLEGYTTLTRMLGSYPQMGYALFGILQQFHWRTAYVLYHSSEDLATGHSDCAFRMQSAVPYLERTEMQGDLIEQFDEILATQSSYRAMMERAKRNARSK